MTDAGIPMGEVLKPCPFCGGEATTVKVDVRPCNVEGWSDAYWVGCKDSVRCSGRLPKLHRTEAAAIGAWNTRAFADTPPPAAAGDRSVARSDFEALRNAVEYLERYNLMPKERRSEARAALDALRTPEPVNDREGG